MINQCCTQGLASSNDKQFNASASEIFAAAILGLWAQIIIGSSSTYGKYPVQRSIPFVANPLDLFYR